MIIKVTKKLIFVLLITHCSSLIASAQWVQQPSGTNQHLYDVWFINPQAGWACGNNGTVLKTTNGGDLWSPQNSGISLGLYSIHFINQNTGWSCSVLQGVSGNIIKTTNGGNNWILKYSTPNRSFSSVFFLDSLRGWVAGTGVTGWVFRTTDGGSSWDSVSIYPATARDVYFVGQQTGWVALGPFIYKSTDSGINWVQQLSSGGGDFQSLSFINVNTGWALILEDYRVYKTTNGGSNWTLLTTLPDCFNAHCITFKNANMGWVSGDCGQIFKTTDGGFNWYQQNASSNYFLQSIQFINDSTGWSVGGQGTILHTTNGGGVVSVSGNENELPKEFKLYQNYPNPFNNKSNIKYQIAKLGDVRLAISTILGREVMVLVNQRLSPGIYQGEINGNNIASGLYFYSLFIDGIIMDTKKLILIK